MVGATARTWLLDPGTSEHEPGEEPRPLDGEEHPAESAGPHRLDVDSLGQHGDFTAADQRHVARLVEHRLADRQQHDHDAHADGEAEEKEERAHLLHQQMAKGERADHGRAEVRGTGRAVRGVPAAVSATMRPSSMWITRPASAASRSSWVTTSRVVPS